VVEKQIPNEQLESIVAKVHGSEHEGEHITLQIEEFNWHNVLRTQDAKLIAASAYYLAMK